MAQKFGVLERPTPTGELFGINANGKGGELLVGYRVADQSTGTNIKVKPAGLVAAYLSDELKDDDRNALVTVIPLVGSSHAQVERMDVITGRRNAVARAPIPDADFTTDEQGEVRFARAVVTDGTQKLYYRTGSNSDWLLLNDESLSKRIELPLGFSADGRPAYLQVEQADGPDAIVSWDPHSNERRTVLRDGTADPARIIRRPGSRVPVGALFLAVHRERHSSMMPRTKPAFTAASKRAWAERSHHLQHARWQDGAGGNLVRQQPGRFLSL